MYLEPHAHEILPRLWVGDLNSVEMALGLGFKVLSVWEGPKHDREDNIPIMLDATGTFTPEKAHTAKLDTAVEWIKANWPVNTVLIHCMAGQERSPLTVCWFLCKTMGLSLNGAYFWVRARRPAAQDRRSWLETAP